LILPSSSNQKLLLVTHAHLDHIGGIPFIMERIGNPPIYTRELTSIMIKKRQEEFPHLPALDIKVLDDNERITLGSLKITTFPVTHSIPDSSGFIIETAYGNVVISGDFKNLANIKNDFSSFLLLCSGGLIFIEMFINIGMNLGLVPVVGIALPFLSYGGSSLIINLAMVGALQSVVARSKMKQY
jgi:hypothetical protein